MTSSTAVPAQSTTPSLGDRIRAARRERGLSQAQLAGQELTKGFISQVESGLVRPSLRSLQIIANRLGKSLDYFLGDQPLAASKRVTFHLLAAQAAAERGNWHESRAAAEAALAAEPEPRDRVKVLRALAATLTATGEREHAFERIGQALSILQTTSDATEHAELLYLRGSNYLALGQLAAATESYEAARDVVERDEVTDPRLRARILVALGTTYRRLDRTAKAMTSYESALSLASRSDELDLAARGYMGVAVSLYDAGELDGAITNYKRALDLFQRVADTSFELNVLQSIATVHLENGRAAEASEYARRALVRGEAVGDVRWTSVAKLVLARIALAERRPDEAYVVASSAERALEGIDRRQHADALRVLGATADALGRWDEAQRHYRASLEALERIEDVADRATVAAEFAQKLRAHGDLEAAFEMLDLARRRAPAAR